MSFQFSNKSTSEAAKTMLELGASADASALSAPASASADKVNKADQADYQQGT